MDVAVIGYFQNEGRLEMNNPLLLLMILMYYMVSKDNAIRISWALGEKCPKHLPYTPHFHTITWHSCWTQQLHSYTSLLLLVIEEGWQVIIWCDLQLVPYAESKNVQQPIAFHSSHSFTHQTIMHATIVMRALKPQILYIHYGKLAEQWLIEMQSMLFVNINVVCQHQWCSHMHCQSFSTKTNFKSYLMVCVLLMRYSWTAVPACAPGCITRSTRYCEKVNCLLDSPTLMLTYNDCHSTLLEWI